MPKEQPFWAYEKRIPSLDGLRCFSILFVIVSHVAFNYPGSVILRLDLGSFGVNIFFVISGFLITFLLLKEKIQNNFISLKNFYTRRILRIIPVAYLFLLVICILKYGFNLDFDAGNISRAALFFENFGDHTSFTATGHYWSVSVEEQFYLLFPFILTCGINLYVRIALLIFICVPLITYTYYHLNPHDDIVAFVLFFLDGFFTHGLLAILTGSLTALLCFQFPKRSFFSFTYPTLVQISLISAAWYLNQQQLLLGINSIISSILIAIFILSVINNKNNIVFKILNLRFIIYIGVISYSLYIWQQIFCFHQPWGNTTFPGKAIAPNMILLFIVAAASYHLYEKQFLKLKNRFSNNRVNVVQQHLPVQLNSLE
jgi:peptidoglycan/LPS O-acetylase OafA/YrhL